MTGRSMRFKLHGIETPYKLKKKIITIDITKKRLKEFTNGEMYVSSVFRKMITDKSQKFAF